MEKLDPCLSMTPNKAIKFTWEQNKQLTAHLHLKNTSRYKQVAYKIKITDPMSFLVKPCVGWIDPDQGVDVWVTFKPAAKMPIVKHKFMIQGSRLEKNTNFQANTFWKGLSKDKYDSLRLSVEFIDQKLVFTEKSPTRASISKFQAVIGNQQLNYEIDAMKTRTAELQAFYERLNKEQQDLSRTLVKLENEEQENKKAQEMLKQKQTNNKKKSYKSTHLVVAALVGWFVSYIIFT